MERCSFVFGYFFSLRCGISVGCKRRLAAIGLRVGHLKKGAVYRVFFFVFRLFFFCPPSSSTWPDMIHWPVRTKLCTHILFFLFPLVFDSRNRNHLLHFQAIRFAIKNSVTLAKPKWEVVKPGKAQSLLVKPSKTQKKTQ